MVLIAAEQINTDVNTGTVQTNSIGGSLTTINQYAVKANNVYIAMGYVQWHNDTPGSISTQIALECPGNNSIIQTTQNGTMYTTGTPAIVGVFNPNANGNISIKLAQFSGSTQTLKLNELKVYKLT